MEGPLRMPEVTLAPQRLDRRRSVPLFVQIYRALRGDILNGSLTPGRRLAATRTLARDLGVSRNTVLQAFDQLLAEGYVESRVGSGTYVARDLPEDALAARRVDRPATITAPRPLRLSTMSRRLESVEVPGALRPMPFQPGIPDVAAFPWRLWQRIVKQQFDQLPPDAFGYGAIAGFEPLRRVIAGHLHAVRGIACRPEEVLVVAGAQQGLDLIARVLLDPGDAAWVEDPGYPPARAAVSAAGAVPVAIPVDDDGLNVACGRERSPDARAAFVTPSHQYPLGSILGPGRRLQLLDWAHAHDAWIVEDDYDGEFRYRSRPLQTLKALDHAGRVIYLGTFSKVMFPALRIGFVVASKRVIDSLAASLYVTSRQGVLFLQSATARFFEGGHFLRHLRRMRVRYEQRQVVLVEAAERHLSGWLRLAPSPAGLHLTGWLPPHVREEAVARAAAGNGVVVVPLGRYCVDRTLPPGLVLGYGAVRREAIEAAVCHLADAIRDVG